MVTSEIAAELAKRTDVNLYQAYKIVKSFIDGMKQAIVDGDRVEIRDFGVFYGKAYEGYRGRNPKTGIGIDVAPKILPRFKAGTGFVKLVNGRGK